MERKKEKKERNCINKKSTCGNEKKERKKERTYVRIE